MSIVLIGYRGSGKTTLGRKLAEKLWLKFADADDLVVAQAGRSIARIFKEEGEAHFRDLERAAVAELLTRTDHVIALGGGAVMDPATRGALSASGHRVIYLRCDARELLRRVQADPASSESRPPLTAAGPGLAEINQVLSQRESVYRQLMHGELDVTRLSADDAVAAVVRLL